MDSDDDDIQFIKDFQETETPEPPEKRVKLEENSPGASERSQTDASDANSARVSLVSNGLSPVTETREHAKCGETSSDLATLIDDIPIDATLSDSIDKHQLCQLSSGQEGKSFWDKVPIACHIRRRLDVEGMMNPFHLTKKAVDAGFIKSRRKNPGHGSPITRVASDGLWYYAFNVACASVACQRALLPLRDHPKTRNFHLHSGSIQIIDRLIARGSVGVDIVGGFIHNFLQRADVEDNLSSAELKRAIYKELEEGPTTGSSESGASASLKSRQTKQNEDTTRFTRLRLSTVNTPKSSEPPALSIWDRFSMAVDIKRKLDANGKWDPDRLMRKAHKQGLIELKFRKGRRGTQEVPLNTVWRDPFTFACAYKPCRRALLELRDHEKTKNLALYNASARLFCRLLAKGSPWMETATEMVRNYQHNEIDEKASALQLEMNLRNALFEADKASHAEGLEERLRTLGADVEASARTETIDEKSLACYACDEHFQSGSDRDRHRIHEHREHFRVGQCRYCGDLSANLFSFRGHLEASHRHCLDELIAKVAYRNRLEPAQIQNQLWIIAPVYKPIETEEEITASCMADNDLEMDRMGIPRYEEERMIVDPPSTDSIPKVEEDEDVKPEIREDSMSATMPPLFDVLQHPLGEIKDEPDL